MNEISTAPTGSKEKNLKRIIIVMSIIIVALVAGLLYQSNNAGEKIDQKVRENLTLQTELDSMMREHDVIKLEYGELADSLTTRDSVIQANADEIKRLIASQADYYRIKKKLDLLRGITQGYVNQIDSLYTVNKQLSEENVMLTRQYHEQVNIAEELERDKTVLEDKVNQAAVLKAYNIVCEGIRYRGDENEKITYKARRVDAVRVCFTLSENPVAKAGKRNIYIRLARPDNVIVTRGKDDAFAFEYQGEMINFSMKEEIDYQNKAMDVCLTWNKQSDEPAMRGVYSVYIFTDGMEIGYAQFELE